jgi:hypothetical protein
MRQPRTLYQYKIPIITDPITLYDWKRWRQFPNCDPEELGDNPDIIADDTGSIFVAVTASADTETVLFKSADDDVVAQTYGTTFVTVTKILLVIIEKILLSKELLPVMVSEVVGDPVEMLGPGPGACWISPAGPGPGDCPTSTAKMEVCDDMADEVMGVGFEVELGNFESEVRVSMVVVISVGTDFVVLFPPKSAMPVSGPGFCHMPTKAVSSCPIEQHPEGSPVVTFLLESPVWYVRGPDILSGISMDWVEFV